MLRHKGDEVWASGCGVSVFTFLSLPEWLREAPLFVSRAGLVLLDFSQQRRHCLHGPLFSQ